MAEESGTGTAYLLLFSIRLRFLRGHSGVGSVWITSGLVLACQYTCARAAKTNTCNLHWEWQEISDFKYVLSACEMCVKCVWKQCNQWHHNHLTTQQYLLASFCSNSFCQGTVVVTKDRLENVKQRSFWSCPIGATVIIPMGDICWCNPFPQRTRYWQSNEMGPQLLQQARTTRPWGTLTITVAAVKAI